MDEGQCKIALKVRDLDVLLAIERKARANLLPVYRVNDKGLTQVLPGTITCIGVGPGPASSVDPLTGHLALL